jgi:short chain dehydrogenase
MGQSRCALDFGARHKNLILEMSFRRCWDSSDIEREASELESSSLATTEKDNDQKPRRQDRRYSPGARKGLGLAAAKLFAKEGAYVFITGRRQKELDEAVEAIGSDVSGVQGDVAKLTDLDRLYETVAKVKGSNRYCFRLRSSLYWLQLRAAIDWNARTCDPARSIGRRKSDYVGDVFRFADPLQCLHPQRDLAARFCLRKIRHICVDYSWCDSIYAYATWPENGGPVFDQSLNCSFGRGISKNGRVFQTGLAHHGTSYSGRNKNDV